jgi:hypothetical protein
MLFRPEKSTKNRRAPTDPAKIVSSLLPLIRQIQQDRGTNYPENFLKGNFVSVGQHGFLTKNYLLFNNRLQLRKIDFL